MIKLEGTLECLQQIMLTPSTIGTSLMQRKTKKLHPRVEHVFPNKHDKFLNINDQICYQLSRIL
jgi:hypothetical protein